jgi:hypothetical protein
VHQVLAFHNSRGVQGRSQVCFTPVFQVDKAGILTLKAFIAPPVLVLVILCLAWLGEILHFGESLHEHLVALAALGARPLLVVVVPSRRVVSSSGEEWPVVTIMSTTLVIVLKVIVAIIIAIAMFIMIDFPVISTLAPPIVFLVVVH